MTHKEEIMKQLLITKWQFFNQTNDFLNIHNGFTLTFDDGKIKITSKDLIMYNRKQKLIKLNDNIT